MTGVGEERVRTLNDQPVNHDGEFVLYWMTSSRRLNFNFAIDRALEWSRLLNKPIVILEALRVDYPWVSVRLHRFVLEGMLDNQRRARELGVPFLAYVEPQRGAGRGLLNGLASRSCVVVTDDFPCFFLPSMHTSAAAQIPVLMESVDSNGLLPMGLPDREFSTAYSFRRYLQAHLKPFLQQMPQSQPLQHSEFPDQSTSLENVRQRWPMLKARNTGELEELLRSLPIDQSIGPGIQTGGAEAAVQRLQTFVSDQLPRYGVDRNHPDADGASGLSAYLHFGHVSAHQVFQAVVTEENWTVSLTGEVRDSKGARSGWWGLSDPAEAFLDELITWRELGYNMCCQRSDYDQFESLPAWAQATLTKHAADPRPFVYDLETLRSARTHDPVWNAAQTQLLREGRLHNYLRMLWAKKILEWSATPREALSVLIELNNAYAVDGRNPNSYSGIFWSLGRYDRPWGPERPVYGKIRYMSSDNTVRKLKMSNYLKKYGSAAES